MDDSMIPRILCNCKCKKRGDIFSPLCYNIAYAFYNKGVDSIR